MALKQNRILMVGDGEEAVSLADQIHKKKGMGKVLAFLSTEPIAPDSKKIGPIPVYGAQENVSAIAESLKITQAIIAMPGASKELLQSIYLKLLNVPVGEIKILPDLSRLEDFKPKMIQTREVRPEDLLSRNPVKICLKQSLSYLRGKRVLITGAGGSIGSELARQLLHGGAQRLYLLDHSENNLYEIHKELTLLMEEGIGEKGAVVPITGELQDKDFIDFIIGRLKADVIFHCAAYKHVPMVEENPVEAIKNNLFGTSFLVEAANKHNVERFVFISTDKAVTPSCVYGVSKLLAEEVVLKTGKHSSGSFMVVRFGNVLGSQGSIVPLFIKQIQKGGPLTITDPEMTRFFMTIPEAASLVLKTGGMGNQGELYILDMGEPIKIIDLAEQLIRLQGLEPGNSIEIQTIGIRPGEKIHEALWLKEETLEPTDHPKINRLLRKDLFGNDIETLLEKLRPVCFFDPSKKEPYRNKRLLKEILSPYFPGLFHPETEQEY